MQRVLSKQQKGQIQSANLNKKFADRLTVIRGDRSHADMARLLNFPHQATYSRYEAGRIPAGDVLYQMAKSLGVSMESLLGETEQNLPNGKHHGPGPVTTAAGRQVDVVAFVRAGPATDYEELPKHFRRQVCTDCRDPDAFGVELRGESMLPVYGEKDVAIVTPSRQDQLFTGCLVAARLKDRGVLFKLLNLAPDGIYRLSSYNPTFVPIEVGPEDFEWLYPVHSVIKYLQSV